MLWRFWIYVFVFLLIYIRYGVLSVSRDLYVEINGNGTLCFQNAPCPDLRTAIEVAPDFSTIFIGPGLWTGIHNTDLTVEGPSWQSNIEVHHRGLRLIGTGATSGDVVIECGNNTTSGRFMSISHNAVSLLQGMTIQNCERTKAAVYWFEESGGAIIVKNTTMTFSSLIFLSNKAAFGGALGAVRSHILLSNSIFEGNVALQNGGALAVDTTTLQIIGSTFTNNSAEANFRYRSQSSGVSGTFNLGGRGGAIYIASNFGYLQQEGFTFMDSLFQNNSAAVGGGAIYIAAQGSNHTNSSFVNTHFYDNSARGGEVCFIDASCNILGGALYINNANATFIQCHFLRNEAIAGGSSESTEGGAIYSTTDVVLEDVRKDGLTIIDSFFKENSARSNSETGQSGGTGGALCSHGTPLHIDNVYFEENTVGDLSMQFYDYSSSGAALYMDGRATVSIRKSYFRGNRAYGGGGGAVYMTGFNALLIQNSFFWDNWAVSSYTIASNGGAMLISHPQSNSIITLRHVHFTNNSAMPIMAASDNSVQPKTYSGYGGAIYLRSADMEIDKCNFTENIAYSGQFDGGSAGGAIFIEDSLRTIIKGCFFTLNGARGYANAGYAGSGNGGAIYSKFAAPSIHESIFSDNWVSAGGTEFSIGGAIAIISEYLESTDINQDLSLEIVGCDFIGNLALPIVCGDTTLPRSGMGGAVAIVGASRRGVRLVNCTFDSNIAQASPNTRLHSLAGGLLATQQSLIEGSTCTFRNNFAVEGFGNDVSSTTSDQPSLVNVRMADCIFETNSPKKLALEASLNVKKVVSRICSTAPSDESFDFDTPDGRQRWGYFGGDLVEAALTGDQGDVIDLEQDEHSRRLAGSGRPRAPPLGILIDSGHLIMTEPSFGGEYHVFVGSVLSFLLGMSPSPSERVTMLMSGGAFDKSNLILTAFGGNVTIVDDSDLQGEPTIGCLALINATLTFSRQLVISRQNYSSLLLEAHLRALYHGRVSRNDMPTIRFDGHVYTGFDSGAIDSLLGLSVVQSLLPARQHNLSIDGCVVSITGDYIITYSSSDLVNNSAVKTYVAVRNNGSIVVESGGTLEIGSQTTILGNDRESREELLLSNNGLVVLRNADTDLAYTGGFLRVNGGFQQSSLGQLSLTLANAHKKTPILVVEKGREVLGKLNVGLAQNTMVDLYKPESQSTWAFAHFDSGGKMSNGAGWDVEAPPGLEFKITDQKDSNDDGHMESIRSSNVACGSLSTYYDGVEDDKDYFCYVCLKNSTCDFCSNGCYDKDTGACKGNKEQRKNCCPDECNGRGSCESQHHDSKFTCECDFFYSGESCDILSIYSYSIIAAGTFVLLFSLLTLRYYYFYRTQKEQVLEKLRFRLLNEVDDDGEAMMDDENYQAYLATIKQALVLRDVRIKYSEIKLEGCVGRGNYGIVYRAMYRGATVALKKMRAPMFLEMTEDDTEEFRKEAAMMSRLRHPNIVLVMGIAFEPGPDNGTGMNDSALLGMGNGGGAAKRERILSDDGADGNNEHSLGRIPCIVTEFLEQGSLADVLYGPKRVADDVWSYAAVLTCAVQAAKGMLYLHSQNPPICHRDLKSSNLVVDDHWVVKVTDFGMSRFMPSGEARGRSFASSITGSFDSNAYQEDTRLVLPNEQMQQATRGSLASRSGAGAGPGAYSSSGHAPGALTQPLIEQHDRAMSGSLRSRGMASMLGAGDRLDPVGDSGGHGGLPELTSNLGTTAWCAPEIFTTTGTAQYSLKVDVYSFGIVLWELWERRSPFDHLKSRFDIVDAVKSGVRPRMSDTCPPAFKALIERCWDGDPERRPNFRKIVRFLTDELAKVKRQHTQSSSVSTGRARSESAWVPGRDLFSGLHPSSADHPTFSPHQLGHGAASPAATFALRDGGVMASHPETGVESGLASAATLGQLNSPSTAGHLSAQGRGPSGKDTDGGGDNVMNPLNDGRHNSNSSRLSPSAGTYGTAPPANMRPLRAWREHFVLKASGWDPSKPDTGLPPPAGAPDE